MAGHGAKLDRLQEACIAALLAAPSIAKAAAKAGVSEASLKAWLRDPDFRAAYRAARQEVLDAAVSALVSATGDSVKALHAAVKAGKPADRIKAAVAILDRSVRGVELLDLLGRVEALEAAQRGQEGGQ